MKTIFRWQDIPHYGSEKVELMIKFDYWCYEHELVGMIINHTDMS
ncbi:hypothetical protein NVP1148O_65 [Vibrio phage 1.148.O._10N.286.54.A10]|nr:hypothetical protein NVP1148O_65 [Vibrio phage 1.148.O._10N.286.54.A10]